MRQKKIILMVCIALTAISAKAQNGINSPYSRYGFGLQSDRAMGFNKGMSGVAQGFRDGTIINVSNPASYSAVDSLTALFDFGLTLQNGNYKMGDLQHNAKNSSFDYAAFHFRATKGLGIALGILPYTSINYKFTSDSEKLSGNDDVTSSYTFNGDGGLHQVFLGAGLQICKPISIGVNGSYLFGDYTHTMTMAFSESSAYSIIRGYSADINSWTVDFGLQYTQPLGKKDKFVLGLTYGLGHDINNKAKRYTETYNASTSTVEGITGDTLKNAFQLPHTFIAGVTYYKGKKMRLGADFELQKWSKCKFPSQDMSGTGQYVIADNQLNDKMKVTIGGDYTPKYNSNKFADRIGYKFGAYYCKSYANADLTGTLSDKPYEYGLSAGVRLPISNEHIWYRIPQINVSVQWVHTNIPYISNIAATPKVSKLTENYIKLSLGLTFSEQWFYKWKVE